MSSRNQRSVGGGPGYEPFEPIGVVLNPGFSARDLVIGVEDLSKPGKDVIAVCLSVEGAHVAVTITGTVAELEGVAGELISQLGRIHRAPIDRSNAAPVAGTEPITGVRAVRGDRR